MLWANTLEDLRNKYTDVVADSELCKDLIDNLSDKKDLSSTERAYLGAIQTIWANHTKSPISKWKTFQRGKDNIEAAVKASPNNIEIRMLRYSVQSNCPKFLNYYDEMDADRDYIVENKAQIKSPALVKMYHGLFKST
ncbi:hypothetical protein DC487_10065 [Sphingobacterium corticibacter]|uniref:Uncharacterized protein n=2 Tax=Sphingobacterium corticibacter TaxID=2171749 RepID=A0A2T8HII0_9SPHI|nr:hypothetical protein DC487_10065 [Sphingobacterium corticibacter]